LLLRVIILLGLVVLGMGLNLCLGEVRLTPSEAWEALFSPNGGGHTSEAVSSMLWQIRMPRAVAAAIVGAALSVSGYLLQSLSRNYLADPYLTGVSSGAALAVAIALALSLPFFTLPIAALAGGLAASFTVAIMARTSSGLSITRLLLGGVALSAVCSSVITLIMTNLQSVGRVQGLFYWLTGSVSGKSWAEVQPLCLYVVIGFIAAMVLSKPMRLLALGTASAASLGLNVPVTQWSLLIAAVVLCGSAVSLSGLVGFVGLMAPYIARSAFGTDERLHLIASCGIGALLVLISDLAARTLMPGTELPLGTLLSLIGGPFFLWLIVRHKDEAL
jgi:iron complex transport system permease protein